MQEHGDENYRLDQPATVENLTWFGKLLGWMWPLSYLAVLEKHDGVCVKGVKGAIVLSFLGSIDLFLVYHEDRHKPDGYWPVAHDECGNYFAFSMEKQDATGECPIVFLEYATENRGMRVR